MAYDHYISKSLTKPWRFGRELHLFDFETDAVEQPRWKKVYGKHDLNSSKLETWLEKMIETPLGRVRRRLEKRDPTALDDPAHFRAAALMVMLQGSRTATALEADGSTFATDAKRTLEDLPNWPLQEIDELVRQYVKDRPLRLVFTPEVAGQWSPLSVPSTGLFPVYFSDRRCPSGWGIGDALPLHPKCAFVVAPPGDQSEIDFAGVAETLAERSVGNSNSKHLVIHRGYVESIPAKKLRLHLRLQRKANDDMLDLAEDRRSVAAKLAGAFGLHVTEDPAGRLVIK